MPRVKLSDVDATRINNMDVLRLLAAITVIFHHAHTLRGDNDPLGFLLGRSSGFVAVGVFFALSGFLIAKSMVNCKSLVDFAVGRCLRIFPGLLVANIVTFLVAAFFLTKLSLWNFLSRSESWEYVLINCSFLANRWQLPGVYENNPGNTMVNGSLWTLPIEARMYFIVFLAGLAALYVGKIRPGPLEKHRRYGAILFGLTACALSFGVWELIGIPYGGGLLSRGGVELMGIFGLGMLAEGFRKKLWLDFRVLLTIAIVFALVRQGQLGSFFFALLLTYSTILISYWQPSYFKPKNLSFDLSYGLYIYSWPIQQIFYQSQPPMLPIVNFFCTFFIVVPLAALSWYFIEHPCLNKRQVVSAWLRRTR